MTAHRSVRHTLVALAALGAPATPFRLASAQTPPQRSAAEIVLKGNDHGAQPCISCHGVHMMGIAAMVEHPRLAGLSTPYLQAQLDAMASGARQSPIMGPVAKALSEPERKALASYIGSWPVRVADAIPADSAAAHADSATVRAGAILATRGRWSSDLPACDRCHGPGGVGVGTAFPPLAGQSSVYLAGQLDAWRKHARPPGPLDLMSTIAERLSDADVNAVAVYYARQPITPAATKRSSR